MVNTPPSAPAIQYPAVPIGASATPTMGARGVTPERPCAFWNGVEPEAVTHGPIPKSPEGEAATNVCPEGHVDGAFDGCCARGPQKVAGDANADVE